MNNKKLTKHSTTCRCKKCAPKLWELITKGGTFGVTGQKSGGKW